MSVRVIQITIPDDKPLPSELMTFTPEENYLMMKIGSEVLIEGRRVVTQLTNKDVHRQIAKEFQMEIDRLCKTVDIEKTTALNMQDKLTRMYETQVEKLNLELSNAKTQIKTFESNTSTLLHDAVDKVKHNYEIILEEKEKQNQYNRELFDKALKMLDRTDMKTSNHIGETGEHIFEELTDTFKDFAEFKIENKTKQGHKGDFHMWFKEFNVLVDVKNYSSVVTKKEVSKIEYDLNTNNTMHFAWLVSLRSNISEHSKFPITFKWMTTDDGCNKCVVMINNLLDYKEPRNALRQAWQMCYEIHKLTTQTYRPEVGEFEKYKERDMLYKKHIVSLQERTNDLRRSINVSLSILKNLDGDLLDVLTTMTNEIVDERFSYIDIVKQWWFENVIFDESENILTSQDVWNRFKKNNAHLVVEHKFTVDQFKDVLVNCVVDSSHYIEKRKRGAIHFVGFQWKEKEVEPVDVNVNKCRKRGTIKYVLSEELDNQIIQQYVADTSETIMTMATEEVRPWQIVSVLVRHHIIPSRRDARGYEEYKLSEEYKHKRDHIHQTQNEIL